MTGTSFWAIGHALDNQRLGTWQLRVIAICGLIQMRDGFDVNSTGWRVPSLILPGTTHRRPLLLPSCGRMSASWQAPRVPVRSAAVSAASLGHCSAGAVVRRCTAVPCRGAAPPASARSSNLDILRTSETAGKITGCHGLDEGIAISTVDAFRVAEIVRFAPRNDIRYLARAIHIKRRNPPPLLSPVAVMS